MVGERDNGDDAVWESNEPWSVMTHGFGTVKDIPLQIPIRECHTVHGVLFGKRNQGLEVFPENVQ